MHARWARTLRDSCAASGVPFFVKQMGGHPNKRADMSEFPSDLQLREFPT
jgi:protein gp37